MTKNKHPKNRAERLKLREKKQKERAARQRPKEKDTKDEVSFVNTDK